MKGTIAKIGRDKRIGGREEYSKVHSCPWIQPCLKLETDVDFSVT